MDAWWHPTDCVKQQAMRWQTAVRDASQIVCLHKTGLPAPLSNVSQGRHKIQVRRKPGKDAAMTKVSGGRPLRQERKTYGYP